MSDVPHGLFLYRVLYVAPLLCRWEGSVGMHKLTVSGLQVGQKPFLQTLSQVCHMA